MRKRALKTALTILGSAALLSLGAGPALAVSGGGYSGQNQNCPPGYGDNLTPTDQTYPGCHTIQLSVESGGTDGHGNATGASNTHYFDMGFNQEPNGYLNEPCIGFIECPGAPGQNASLHSGCVGANTDGTGSAPAPAGSQPEDPGTAGDASNGCGDNPKGLGFSANFDYFQFLNLVCPTVNQAVGPVPPLTIPFGAAGNVGVGDPCEYESKQVSQTSVTPHTGTAVAYKPILKQGLIVYFGGDDNQNHGEHDGVGPYTKPSHANRQRRREWHLGRDGRHHLGDTPERGTSAYADSPGGCGQCQHRRDLHRRHLRRGDDPAADGRPRLRRPERQRQRAVRPWDAVERQRLRLQPARPVGQLRVVQLQQPDPGQRLILRSSGRERGPFWHATEHEHRAWGPDLRGPGSRSLAARRLLRKPVRTAVPDARHLRRDLRGDRRQSDATHGVDDRRDASRQRRRPGPDHNRL